MPHAIAQAIHHAALPPAGPAFVSIPMDDWAVDLEERDYALHIAREEDRALVYHAPRCVAPRRARRAGRVRADGLMACPSRRLYGVASWWPV